MNRTFKALPLFSLLLLMPVLATAQATPTTTEDPRNAAATTAPASSFGVRNAANTRSNPQSAKAATDQGANDKRKQRYTEALDDQRYVATDTQATVLVSEICTYSQYTYTYTCK